MPLNHLRQTEKLFQNLELPGLDAIEPRVYTNLSRLRHLHRFAVEHVEGMGFPGPTRRADASGAARTARHYRDGIEERGSAQVPHTILIGTIRANNLLIYLAIPNPA